MLGTGCLLCDFISGIIVLVFQEFARPRTGRSQCQRCKLMGGNGIGIGKDGWYTPKVRMLCSPQYSKMSTRLSCYVSCSFLRSFFRPFKSSISSKPNRNPPMQMQIASQKQTQTPASATSVLQSVPTPSLCLTPFLSPSMTSSLCFFNAYHSHQSAILFLHSPT